ncbi:helix-turn-helix transcriptional regulator [Halocatena marina]|uniref:Helix-turn-helix transcriptional regulator n=1 Tax=Halocatena marina TaxID=2934937 RepID=A0ABD5YK71_9EURY|nr:ArsR family transcriptional regulator [Halocatena marina]
MNDYHDDIQFLSASPHRIQILQQLRDDPCPPCDITEVLELSRRGVQRNLSSLVDRGWIEKIDGRYHLTTNGEFIALQYADFLSALETIETCKPFFANLPTSEHAPNPKWLADAEIIVADSSQPHAPLRQYTNTLREDSIETLRGLVPILSQLHTEIYAELLGRGTAMDLVLPQTAAEPPDPSHAAEFEDLFAAACNLYVYEGTIGVGLTLTDQRGIVGSYDEQGHLSACVSSTNPALLGWAERLYERYWRHSRPLSANTQCREGTTPP